MNTQKPVILLLTATISPPLGCPDLKRTNPELRLADYANALGFYLKIPNDIIDRIVFVENSNANLDSLKKIVSDSKTNKKVEFLSYVDGNNFPPEYGKGYGEMRLLDYAINNSQLVTSEDIIWKATGRLILKNIQTIIKSTTTTFDVYCDIHNQFKLLKLTSFFDPRFYAFTIRGYHTFFQLPEEQLRYIHIEHFYYNLLIQERSNKKVHLRFKHQPLIVGHSGSVNDSYSSLKKMFQYYVLEIFRLIFPTVWL